jgi:hypothetical protein
MGIFYRRRVSRSNTAFSFWESHQYTALSFAALPATKPAFKGADKQHQPRQEKLSTPRQSISVVKQQADQKNQLLLSAT